MATAATGVAVAAVIKLHRATKMPEDTGPKPNPFMELYQAAVSTDAPPSPEPTAEQYQSTGTMLVSHDPADPVGSADILPPANVDVPHAYQAGEIINCTMGNWDYMQGEPQSYAYQWRRDGIDLFNAVANTVTVTVDDVGHSYDCLVTATNGQGTAAVWSNAVVAVDPAPAA
jgi:hypothetical protein